MAMSRAMSGKRQVPTKAMQSKAADRSILTYLFGQSKRATVYECQDQVYLDLCKMNIDGSTSYKQRVSLSYDCAIAVQAALPFMIKNLQQRKCHEMLLDSEAMIYFWISRLALKDEFSSNNGFRYFCHLREKYYIPSTGELSQGGVGLNMNAMELEELYVLMPELLQKLGLLLSPPNVFDQGAHHRIYFDIYRNKWLSVNDMKLFESSTDSTDSPQDAYFTEKKKQSEDRMVKQRLVAAEQGIAEISKKELMVMVLVGLLRHLRQIRADNGLHIQEDPDTEMEILEEIFHSLKTYEVTQTYCHSAIRTERPLDNSLKLFEAISQDNRLKDQIIAKAISATPLDVGDQELLEMVRIVINEMNDRRILSLSSASIA